ncbi:hypothetical protein QDQ39_19825 [Providencia rettgeri]|uniref:hypothetical protein n=1 Tax=Providencia rettgeri TaxID=587 RepID=UPI00244C546A|nr:hypothetical protein [Providencia rettgeri]MDH2398055.1 hypothetical protein [Providencia rettgeri]HBK4773896.1 hypothetical protein [Providencia rettgeri]HEF8779560.1 hypothetical protein [Providencia rettgeri]
MSAKTINELVKFKDEIKSICKLRYKNEWNAMYAMHDWDIYFREGYRANNAHEAVDEARACM